MQYTALLNTPRRSIAAFLLLTLVSWSMGLPTFIHTARAASLNHVSDLLSDSGLSALSNHTITFTTPTGIAVDETVTITFPAGFNINGTAFGDIDISDDGADLEVAAAPGAGTWGAVFAGQVLTLTNSNDTAVAADSVMVVEIGLNATFNATPGDTQIINPGSNDTQLIAIAGTMTDSADTRVYIVEHVLVTAEVDTIFEFQVDAVADTEMVNGSAVDITSTPTTLAFGVLVPNASTTMAQDLSVKTNAQYGFTVTVQADGNLRSDTGADINPFIDDVETVDPVVWQAPAATIDDDLTYGHEGITSEDDLNVGGAFGTMEYAGNFVATPRAIFSHTGPVTWTTPGQYPDIATTRVGYTIEISPLQEAADDYQQTLRYVATPTF
jgi:hypothetical protein